MFERNNIKYYNTKEAAEMLNVSIATIAIWVRFKRLPRSGKYNGTRIAIHEQDITDILDNKIDVSGIYKEWRKKYAKKRD